LALSLDGIDTVFICNPNNPTGHIMPHDGLVRLCRSHPKIQFVIDESYMPFAAEGQSSSLVDNDLQNVSVLWSLSKIFGVPGLRAGFLIANGSAIYRFRRYMQPWSMNSLAQAAVDYLCSHQASMTAFIETTRRFLQKERQRFYDELVARSGMTAYPSCTSYILLKLPAGVNAQGVCRQMLQHRILIRDCSNFHGLSDRFIRVSIKHPMQNRRAADCLAKIVSGSGRFNSIGK
jgi:threonine-phosphate decarboxylase